MDECCGTGIYWCPTAGEFQCPTHSGHDVCCDRPERHTPLARFEAQAKALLRWWQEERGGDHTDSASTPRGSSFFEQTIAAHNDEQTDP